MKDELSEESVRIKKGGRIYIYIYIFLHPLRKIIRLNKLEAYRKFVLFSTMVLGVFPFQSKHLL